MLSLIGLVNGKSKAQRPIVELLPALQLPQKHRNHFHFHCSKHRRYHNQVNESYLFQAFKISKETHFRNKFNLDASLLLLSSFALLLLKQRY